MSHKVWTYILALFILVGCHEHDMTANQAIEISRSYLAQTYPQAPLDKLEVKVVDLRKTWQVTYADPGEGTGGPIIVVVDKRSRKVVHWATQQ